MHDVQQQAYPVERAPPARQYLLGQTTGPDGESDTTEGENDMSRMHVTVLQYLLEILDRAGPIAEGNTRFAAPDKGSYTSPSARDLQETPRECMLPEQCLGHPLINLERGGAVLLCGMERLQPQVRLRGARSSWEGEAARKQMKRVHYLRPVAEKHSIARVQRNRSRVLLAGDSWAEKETAHH